MKKFILGVAFGIVISASTVAYATESIQTLLFPVKFEFNGKNAEVDDVYKVLNYNGHAYVPIRFVAENIGAAIDYDPEPETIIVKNSDLDITDPTYNGGISVGNLILIKDGENTKVIYQLKMENDNNDRHMIGANLSFYNDHAEKIGEIVITGDDFSNQIQTFEAIGTGDFREYSSVKLHIGAIDGRIVGGGPRR
jgi:hypothetical protein